MKFANLLYNFLPFGCIKARDRLAPYKTFFSPGIREGMARYRLLQKNIVYKNIHKNRRCFLIGNAPSINDLDLSLLAEEISFSVSSGYHHPLYAAYKPRYHCLPGVTYSHLFTEETAVEWFKEMHASLGDAELFLATQEYELIRRYGLFPGRTVNYVGLYKTMDSRELRIDLTNLIYGVQSSPIMALQLAFYMGFSEIYLIGFDHDSVRTGKYTYFYEPTILKNKDLNVDSNGQTLFTEDLYTTYSLFQQYEHLKRYAESRDCKIYNAGPAGVLDLFDRVSFAGLFSR